MVEIKFKEVFGKRRCYPVNLTGKRFADLLRKKTFEPEDLEIIKSLGFEIKEVNDTLLKEFMRAQSKQGESK